MSELCRDAIRQVNLKEGQHAGLMYQRYLPRLSKDKSELKNQLIPAMQQAYQQPGFSSLYRAAFDRYRQSLEQDQVLTIPADALGRLIVGLGNSSPVETGLTLHHTYGTPLLPGSALKGLAAHYCHQVWGAENPAFQSGGEHYQILFGSQDDAGCLVFYDAWLQPSSLKQAIQADIMTVHHGEYYTGKASKAPTDFDEPTPIGFVSLTGRFLLAVGCRLVDEQSKQWSQLGLKLLAEALQNWGIGAKTSSGYGRMKGVWL